MAKTNTNLLNLVTQILEAKTKLAEAAPGQMTHWHQEVNRLHYAAIEEIQMQSYPARVTVRDADERLGRVLNFFTIE